MCYSNNEMALHPRKVPVFVLGFFIGVILAFVITVSKDKFGQYKPSSIIENVIAADLEGTYHTWLTNLGYIKYKVNFDYFSYSGNKSLVKSLESQLLKATVNVMCVMFIKNVKNVHAAMNTWTKHCNSIKLYGLKKDKYLNMTVLQPKSSWHYLCEVIKDIDSRENDYMWVLFVYDNIFAIPENLRRFVLSKNFQELHYLGYPAFTWNVRYNLAEAGYVLSRGSIKALRHKFPSTESCINGGKYWNNEDYFLGKYLTELGVPFEDTRDQFGRGRFHMFTPAQLIAPGDVAVLSKYYKSALYPVVQGKECCSTETITFQGTDSDRIYFYYYVLYNLHVHSEPGSLGNVKSSRYVPSDQVWQQFVLDELGPNANLSAISLERYYQLWNDKIDSPSTFNKKLRALFGGKSND